MFPEAVRWVVCCCSRKSTSPDRSLGYGSTAQYLLRNQASNRALHLFKEARGPVQGLLRAELAHLAWKDEAQMEDGGDGARSGEHQPIYGAPFGRDDYMVATRVFGSSTCTIGVPVGTHPPRWNPPTQGFQVTVPSPHTRDRRRGASSCLLLSCFSLGAPGSRDFCSSSSRAITRSRCKSSGRPRPPPVRGVG